MGACLWPGNNEIMIRYHNNEWCVPSYEDAYIFEMLTLEGAQAGLSWNTVLVKREDYQSAFHYFDIPYCMNHLNNSSRSILNPCKTSERAIPISFNTST